MKSLILFLLIFSFLFADAKDKAAENEYHVIVCTILDKNGAVKHAFQGQFCNFLEDGSYISNVFIDKESYIARFGPYNELIWKRKFNIHHQINLTSDKKNVIALTHEFVDNKICKTRFDNIEIFNVDTGKTVFSWHSKNYIDDLNKLKFKYHTPILATAIESTMNEAVCKITHMNSVYEVPEIKNSNKNPAFKQGNLVVNFLGLGTILIIDKNTKKIVWESSLDNAKHTFFDLHDVQLSTSGEFYYKRNYHPQGAASYTSFEFYNPETNIKRTIFPKLPNDKYLTKYMGGIQILGDEFLISGNSVTEGGWVIRVDSNGKILNKYFHPYLNPLTNIPQDIQDVKSFEISNFLKNNYLTRNSVF